MKKVYESPVFLAEAYSFSSSIANCNHSSKEPVTVRVGEALCLQGDGGHKYGGQSGDKGTLVKNEIREVTLFNDGAGTGCPYDWNKNDNQVTGPDGVNYGTFAQAFFGNNSNVEQHSLGYGGDAFFS